MLTGVDTLQAEGQWWSSKFSGFKQDCSSVLIEWCYCTMSVGHYMLRYLLVVVLGDGNAW